MEEAGAKMKARDAQERKRKKLRKKEKRLMVAEDIQRALNDDRKKTTAARLAFLHATDSAFIWIALLSLHVASAPASSAYSHTLSLFLSPSFIIWLIELVAVGAWGLFTYFCFCNNITSIAIIESLLTHGLWNFKNVTFQNFFDALLAVKQGNNTHNTHNTHNYPINERLL